MTNLLITYLKDLFFSSKTEDNVRYNVCRPPFNMFNQTTYKHMFGFNIYVYGCLTMAFINRPSVARAVLQSPLS